MRYYEITLTKAGATKPYRTWSSQTNGVFNPSALDIEIDCPVSVYGIPGSGNSITIHGVDMADLMQTQNFTGDTFVMKAGMQKGLPLANPLQAGIIVQGIVFQSYGNWQGTDLSISFVINPGVYTQDNPGNFVLNWTAGLGLHTALTNMFSVVYPSMPVSMNISTDLVLSHDEPHHASTLDGIADVVLDMTKGNFIGAAYPGVSLSIQAGKVLAFDQTVTSASKQIVYTDLIGQPTWIAPLTMIMKVVMRYDLQLGSTFTMPKGLQNTPGAVATTQNSLSSQLKSSLTFSGDFIVIDLRHIGSFRSPDGGSWVTVITAIAK